MATKVLVIVIIFSKNSKENGQYHSNWLNMMYPRLALAKSLLRDDGVIFVSIDDNEVANLRLLMDEIFGEENFIANFISSSKEFITLFLKSENKFLGSFIMFNDSFTI